jgi:hypothetical protein
MYGMRPSVCLNRTYELQLEVAKFASELYRPSDRRFVGEVSANLCG